MRFVPDWLLYIIVIAAVVYALFEVDDRANRANAPEALPGSQQVGAFLPPPTAFDPQILVEVAPASSGLGTAFAISENGWWVTARHVVDACEQVGIIVSRQAAAPVDDVKVSEFADLALLKTARAPVALSIDTSERHFQIGQRAFHIGFPQGRPGEAYSRLIGRETLVARGRYSLQEPVLTWGELGRTSGMRGSLSGLSGAPTFSANGQVIGVTVAESARRGRIYTASPSSLMRFLEVEHVVAEGSPGPRLSADTYGQQADNLRRELAIAQVVCIGPGGQRF